METNDLYQEVTQLHAQLCSALADPRRILMIYTLAVQPFNVTNLAETLDISQPAASRHLKVLKESGLVQSTRKGASVEYQLTDRRLVDALDLLRKVLYDRITHRADLVEEVDVNLDDDL